jgi:hypothetical protein
MIGFNLSTNFIDDLEALLKRTKAKLKRVPALESEDNRIRQSLTPEFEAMANKSLREFSAPTTANIVLDLKSMLETMDSSSSLLSSTWCKSASFVERHMKMLVHISNTFWRSVAPSLSRE